MAKEFQFYNRKYAKLAGTALKFIGVVPFGKAVAVEDIAAITKWNCSIPGYRFTEDYTVQRVRWAVYESPGAEMWQKFRVRLKGLNTREKLYALAWWLDAEGPELTEDIIRVNNYLGALKRSGHLNDNLEVVKL